MMIRQWLGGLLCGLWVAGGGSAVAMDYGLLQVNIRLIKFERYQPALREAKVWLITDNLTCEPERDVLAYQVVEYEGAYNSLREALKESEQLRGQFPGVVWEETSLAYCPLYELLQGMSARQRPLRLWSNADEVVNLLTAPIIYSSPERTYRGLFIFGQTTALRHTIRESFDVFGDRVRKQSLLSFFEYLDRHPHQIYQVRLIGHYPNHDILKEIFFGH